MILFQNGDVPFFQTFHFLLNGGCDNADEDAGNKQSENGAHGHENAVAKPAVLIIWEP